MYFKCYRCKKLYERNELYAPNISVYKYTLGEKRLDLCDECQKKLEQFVEHEDEGAKK